MMRLWSHLIAAFRAFASRTLACVTLACVGLTCVVAPATVHAIASEVGSISHSERNLRLARLGLNDGLSQSIVNSIAQDKHGYMWFGTQEGLNRYDGRDFSIYEHVRSDATSLSHDWVFSLLVDSEGRLWVGTNGGGLNLYNAESDAFTAYRHDSNDPYSLSNDKVRTIFEDRAGALWVGTVDGGLNLMSRDDQRFTHYRHDPENPRSLPNDTVVAVLEDSLGVLWVGTPNGLARFDRLTESFVNYRHKPEDSGSISHDSVLKIYEDNQGRLWIATENGGLNLFDRSRETFRQFQHDEDDQHSLAGNLIRDLLMDHQGVLWIATEGGLNELNDDYTFTRYSHAPNDTSSLSTNRLTSLYQDTSGTLWIGSYEGVNKWNYISDAFSYYGTFNGVLETDVVTGVAEDSKGNTWIGTYGKGLSRIDKENGAVRHYVNKPRDAASLSDDRVMSLIVDKHDNVWAGTRAGGINYLAVGSNRFTRYQAGEGPGKLSSNGIASLHMDDDGTLWAGTYGAGLNRFDGKSFETFRHDLDDETSIGDDRILDVYRDRSGVLWVGTESGGLNRFSEDTRDFLRIQANPKDPTSLTSNAAWEILEDKEGSLWIGTLAGGLNKWSAEDRQAGITRFTSITKEHGLLSDTVFGILEDEVGALWISTNRGLTQYNPASQFFRHFDARNGLRGDEFHTGVKLRNSSGQLMFGGTSGLVAFYPTSIARNPHVPTIVITASSRGEPIGSSFSHQPFDNVARLSYPYYSVTFDFAALDFVSPDKNQYRYKLKGYDDKWIDPKGYLRAAYTNLPAGNYEFQVIAANNDGIWNEAGAVFPVLVEAPPWASAAAYLVYFLVVCALVTWIVTVQRRKMIMMTAHEKALEQQVELRTEELNMRNQQLQRLNEKLKEVSLTDALTGLNNRRHFYEFITQQVAQVERDHFAVSMQDPASLTGNTFLFFMMIDLDGFKGINDNHGHHAGDRVLVQVSELLLACSRESDTVFRWGGDEFFIAGQVAKAEDVEHLAERIRARIANHPFDIGGGRFPRLSASIGAAPYPFSSRQLGMVNWEQVVDIADKGAYAAKLAGKNNWVFVGGTEHTDDSVLDLMRRERISWMDDERLYVSSSIAPAVLAEKVSG